MSSTTTQRVQTGPSSPAPRLLLRPPNQASLSYEPHTEGADGAILRSHQIYAQAERSLQEHLLATDLRCAERAFLEIEIDRLRVLAGDGQATKVCAAKAEQLACTMVHARNAFDRAVYQTIAADRGHVGRAFAALDAIPRERGTKARWRNNFRAKPWCIGERLLSDGKKRGTKRRAVPDIPDFLLLLEADHGHRIPIAPLDTHTTKVRELLEQVARHSKHSPESIRLLLGNAVLPPDCTLAECSVQSGTVLVYSLPTAEETLAPLCDDDDDGPPVEDGDVADE